MKTRIFTFISLTVWVFVPFFAYATDGRAALFLSPAHGSFFVGSTFDVSIILDTKGNAVNTVEVELLFPSDILQISSPSTGASLVQVWAAPPLFSNREGKMYFVGGIPSPGIETSQGVVLTLTFRVVSPGEAKIEFGPKTSILANDGLGTDILKQSAPAFFKFTVPPPQGPKIFSPTHSDQDIWHKDPNPIFVWSKGPFANNFSYSIDKDPSGFPDTISDGKNSSASFNDLGNGIWYFHLREEAGGVWGGVSHYAIKIDKEPPASFKLNISPGLRTTNKNPIFRFFTTDSLSGFDHFELKIISLSNDDVSDALFFEITSPYQASNLKSGRNQVIVRAFDKAGNSKDSSAIVTIVSSFSRFLDADGINAGFVFISWNTIISWLFFALLVAILILWSLWVRHKQHISHAFWQDIKKYIPFLKKIHLPFLVIFLALSMFLVPVFWHNALAKEISLPPTINIVPEQYYPFDDTLYIEGKAPPHSQIEILFERVSGGASPLRINVKTNSVGDWFLSEKTELASGEWYIRARVLDDPPSDWSNPRIIRSIVSGFIIGGLKVKYVPITILLISLFTASIALIMYLLLRIRSVQRTEIERQMKRKNEELEKKLRDKEKEELDLIIEQNFDELKKDLLEELEHIESKTKSGKFLSSEEEEHKSDILKKLNEIEEKIEKNIRSLS